jgi:gliding motility-associated-like protein
MLVQSNLRLIIFTFFSICFLSIKAQQVLNTTGNYFRFENYTLSYSIGETAVQTLKSSNGSYLTQGVLQPLSSLIPSKPLVTLPLKKAVCIGGMTEVSFSTLLLFGQDNEFTIEVSNEKGSFENPITIGKAKGTTIRKVPIEIPASLAPGNYLMRVVSSNAKEIGQTTNLLVRKKPLANFSLPVNACTGDSVFTTFTGKDTISNANFIWNFSDGLLVNNQATKQQGNIWSINGSKKVSLIISNDGCESEKFEQSIEVDRKLSPALITCGKPSGNSISFNWSQVGGATDYKERVVSGTSETGVKKGNSLSFSNLAPGSKIKIEVQAIGSGICGVSVDTQTCSTIVCPTLTATLAKNQINICAGEPARTSLTLGGGNGIYRVVYTSDGTKQDTLSVRSEQLFDFFPEQNANYTFLAVGNDALPGCYTTLNKPIFQVKVTPNNYPGKPEPALSVCSNQDTPIMLDDLLKDESSGGKWRSFSPVDSNSFDPAMPYFIPKGNKPGKYFFIYRVEGANRCKERESSVEVRIEQKQGIGISTYANCLNNNGTSIISLQDVAQRANPFYPPNQVRWYRDSTLKDEIKGPNVAIANKLVIYTKIGQGLCASNVVSVILMPNDSAKLQLPIIQGTERVKLGDTIRLFTTNSYPSNSIFVWTLPNQMDTSGADIYQLKFLATKAIEGRVTLKVRAPQQPKVATCISEDAWFKVEVIDDSELDLSANKIVNMQSPWKIDGLDNYPNHKIKVFNRWGELVYQAEAYQNNWHGECTKNCSSSGILPHGTYYYVIESGKAEDKKAKKGALYIIE